MSRGAFFLLILLFLSFPLFFSFANDPSTHSLLIVEIQIAGDKVDNDHIKIYNPLDIDLDVSGYKLKKTNSKGNVSLIKVFPIGSVIPAKGYFIWGNSKENYASIIKANISSSATLTKNNSIALFTSEEKIIDAVGWGDFYGLFIEKTPFPKNPNANQILKRKLIKGFYQDTDNNKEDFYLSPEESFEPISQKSEKINTIYPAGIVINEILPSPLGPDETDEWIEIFNKNDFDVNLSGWQIKDAIGKITNYIIPIGTKISSQGFLLLKRTETKIVLNETDGLILISPDGKTVDSVNYQKAVKNNSYNRIENEWVWSENLSPGKANIISSSSNNENNDRDLKEKKTVEKTTNNQKIYLCFVLLGLVVFSGATILILKKKLK